jgi:prepilin-type processing-associated H-X9-DG protein
MGDPDRGFGKGQPGSWMFAVLPYIEQATVFEIAMGGSGWPVPAAKRAKMVQTEQTPVSTFACPSRRTAGPRRVRTTSWFNVDQVPVPPGAGSTDYAANHGSGSAVPIDRAGGSYRVTATYTNVSDQLFATGDHWNGISFPRSEVRMADITDGTSNTYLLGEKFVNPDDYTTGMDYGDDDSCLTGYSFVQHRMANASWPPQPDASGGANYYGFGSAHAGSLNMAFCDGSIRSVSYTLDGATHSNLGSRNDQNVIDMKAF